MTGEAIGSVRLSEIFILDPGLCDRFSHHHVINRQIVHAAHLRGVGVCVFGHRGAVSGDTSFGYRFAPRFRCSIYEDSPVLGAERYAEQVRSHAEDIAGTWDFATVGAPVGVLVHTATAAFLQGFAEAWSRAPTAVGALAVQLMFRPESMAARETDVGACWARYGRALRSLRTLAAAIGARFSLSTSCLEFARAFAIAIAPMHRGGTGERATSDRFIKVHPHAVYSRLTRASIDALYTATALSSSTRPGQQGDRVTVSSSGSTVSRVLMFSGEPKLDKGLSWVVEALPPLLAGDAAHEYWLHLGPNRFARPEIDTLFREIRALQAAHDRLRVVWGHIGASEWRGLFARMDRVVVPYDPVAYRHKTSGVFGDCLRYMRSDARLLISSGGWLAREASAWRIGHATCQYGDVAGLVAWLNRPAHRSSASRWPPMGDPRTLSSELWATAFGRGNDEFLLDAVLGPAG